MCFFIKHSTQPKEAKEYGYIYITVSYSHTSACNKKFICPAGPVYRIHRLRIFRRAGIDLRRKKRSSAAHISLENAKSSYAYISQQREVQKSHTPYRDKFAKVHCTLLLINFHIELGQTSILATNYRCGLV